MAEKKTAAKAEATKATKNVAKAQSAQPRLKALYNSELKAKLKEELGLDNINQVPELKKIVVSSDLMRNQESVWLHGVHSPLHLQLVYYPCQQDPKNTR